VARSFKKEICMCAPGSCMPACHAKAGWRSRRRILGDDLMPLVRVLRESWRAMAIAREAGPRPMQMRSCTSSEAFDANAKLRGVGALRNS
jgi:hypothetical protein